MLHVIPSHQGRPSDDPIFALNKEATERKARGESVVNATVGALLHDDGKLAILPTAARAVQEVAPEEWATYAPIAGSPDFLAAVIDDLFAGEPEMRACAVAGATPGGTGALRHAIANYMEPHHALLTTSYFWGPYQTLCDETERKLSTFSMFDEKGGFDVAALDAAVARQIAEQKRVLLFLNDPCHNPTGYSMSMEEWRAVVACLLRHADAAPITLLADMAYYAYGARAPRAFLAELLPLLGKVGLLFAWSASKSFTHYGLRVGALVSCVPDAAARAATAAALSYSSRGTWSNCSRGGMRAIARLLTTPELRAACDEERDELRALLDARVAAFNEHASKAGLKYPRYEGGFFVTVFCDDAIERALRMKEKGVFVVPSKGCLRVALCSVPAKDVERLVTALAD
ncbi:MAG: aminotransferase class I/II-fold pyridoxal phosphate-dependent enzyme [Labilithrix sp.]|nr:aminotransferase class I/II-fold pyridoxal phosphate-dependent enzyme [Labilithrix sp.]MCW5818093.1 aminotransferase class I/II-fold pyridoxal phosphate-dependent enzyme [Labilithrix sp.]